MTYQLPKPLCRDETQHEVDYCTAEQMHDDFSRLRAIELAANSLVKAKGRYHTEQNYKALAALLAAAHNP